MSKRVFILSLMFLGVLSFARAAAEEELPPPLPPLLREAPANAAWTIQCKPPGEENAEREPAPRQLRRVDVTKTGQTRREIRAFSDGSRTEYWHFGGYDLVQSPEGHINLLDPGMSDIAPSYGGHRDFPEFQWIALEYYVGKVKLGGRLCDHYRYSAAPAPLVEGQAPRGRTTAPGTEAWVDAETKLPLLLWDGELRQQYSFGEAPAAPLQLPPAFLAEYQAYLAPARNAARYHMAP